MAESAKPSLPLFPIQLRKVDIGQVAYTCQRFSDPAVVPATKFELNVAVSPFSDSDRSFQVSLTFQCSNEKSESPYYPYSLALTIHGEFGADLERLKHDGDWIKKWGEKNGVFCFRSCAKRYSFTQKTGFKPLLIPLVETSAFGVAAPPPPAGTEIVRLPAAPPTAEAQR